MDTTLHTTQNAFFEFLAGLGTYAEEVGIALAPIVAVLHSVSGNNRAFHKRQIIRIAVGIIITFIGLTLFLTAQTWVFAPMGTLIGQGLGGVKDTGGWLLIPVGMIIGYFVVAAEPAVHVLNKQVERMSAGRNQGCAR